MFLLGQCANHTVYYLAKSELTPGLIRMASITLLSSINPHASEQQTVFETEGILQNSLGYGEGTECLDQCFSNGGHQAPGNHSWH